MGKTVQVLRKIELSECSHIKIQEFKLLNVYDYFHESN